MRSFLILLLAAFTFSKAHAQGCVVVRSNGGTCTMSGPSHTKENGWLLGLNSRYFKSFRHYSATDEQKQRLHNFLRNYYSSLGQQAIPCRVLPCDAITAFCKYKSRDPKSRLLQYEVLKKFTVA